MIINTRLVPEGHSVIEQEEASLAAFKDDLPPSVEPVKCRAEVDRMGGTIAVALRFDGVFEAECARCLGPVAVPVGGGLRVIIQEGQGKHGPSVDGGCADFYFDANHDIVDIGSAVYDEIMIALPMMPLCSEECKGIEAGRGAGADEDRAVDPRWEGLTKLKGIVH
ncbi:MAG: DUF177 domain-containing protein [Chitinispirillales bacterium]|jgi:uncharacterized protein|nr:DUF177 domain-containing protein [Chitinispirillales bacterium]